MRGSDELPRKKYLQEEERTDLLSLLDRLDLDSTEADTYREATENIIALQDAAVNKESEVAFQRKSVFFAFMMPPEFMNLLDNYDPRALVVLAHYICIAKFLDRL